MNFLNHKPAKGSAPRNLRLFQPDIYIYMSAAER